MYPYLLICIAKPDTVQNRACSNLIRHVTVIVLLWLQAAMTQSRDTRRSQVLRSLHEQRLQGHRTWASAKEVAHKGLWAVTDNARYALILAVFGFKVGSPRLCIQHSLKATKHRPAGVGSYIHLTVFHRTGYCLSLSQPVLYGQMHASSRP